MENKRNNELEEMRAQLGLLKAKLEKEIIVNERLMRRTMKERMHPVMREKWLFVGLGLFAMLLITFSSAYIGVPDGLKYFALVFCVAEILYTLYAYGDLRSEDFLTLDPVSLKRKLIRFRRLNLRCLFVSIPFLIVFIGGYLMSIGNNRAAVVGCLVGVAIGGVYGVRTLMRRMQTLREVMVQIEELTAGERV